MINYIDIDSEDNLKSKRVIRKESKDRTLQDSIDFKMFLVKAPSFERILELFEGGVERYDFSTPL